MNRCEYAKSATRKQTATHTANCRPRLVGAKLHTDGITMKQCKESTWNDQEEENYGDKDPQCSGVITSAAPNEIEGKETTTPTLAT